MSKPKKRIEKLAIVEEDGKLANIVTDNWLVTVGTNPSGENTYIVSPRESYLNGMGVITPGIGMKEEGKIIIHVYRQERLS